MVHSLGSYANPVEIFFKISPDHLNIDMSWHVRMIETIKQPLETLLMTPWKWPIWVILHCKNCTSENFRAEGGHHFFFTFFGFPSLILTIRSYPGNFIASRKCKVTPSKNTVAAWVFRALYKAKSDLKKAKYGFLEGSHPNYTRIFSQSSHCQLDLGICWACIT